MERVLRRLYPPSGYLWADPEVRELLGGRREWETRDIVDMPDTAQAVQRVPRVPKRPNP